MPDPKSKAGSPSHAASPPPMALEPLESRTLLSATYTVGSAPGFDYSTIQAALDNPNLAPGDVIEISEGIYREKLNLKTSGTDGNPITLRSAPGAAVSIRGTDVVTDWTLVPGTTDTYVSTGLNGGSYRWSAAALDNDPNNDPEFVTSSFAKGWDQIYVNGVYYSGIPWKGVSSTLEPGQFKREPLSGNDRWTLRLRPEDAAVDLSAGTVEVTKRNQLLKTNGQDHWFVQNLDFRQGANKAQASALVEVEGTGHRFTGVDISYANGSGISLRGNNNIFEYGSLNDNGALGLHSTQASNNVVRHTEIARNNLLPGKQYKTGVEAGGAKLTRTDGFVFDAVEVHGNWGSGIWFDAYNENSVITNSVGYNNLHAVHIEISYTASIYNNVFHDNVGQGSLGGNRGQGIYVASSGGNEIYNNTVYGNQKDGIFIGQPSLGVRGDLNDGFRGPYDNTSVRNVSSSNALGSSTAVHYNIRRTFGTGDLIDKGINYGPALELLALDNPRYAFDDYLRLAPDDPNLTPTEDMTAWLNADRDALNFSDENVLHRGTGSSRVFGGNFNTTIAQWQAEEATDGYPTAWENNSIQDDPLLIDPQNGDFRLADNSPAHALRAGATPGETAGDALVGAWNLDGDFYDHSYRRTTNAVVNGDVAFNAAVSGQGLSFDGTGDTVRLPLDDGALLDSSKGSIGVWFKAGNTGKHQMLVYGTENGGDGFGGQNELHLHVEQNGQLGFFIEGGSNDVRLTSGAGLLVNDGEWHHAAATWDISGQAVLYLNGEQVDADDHNARAFVTSDVRLGRTATGAGSRFLNGQLDDLRIYDRDLAWWEVLSVAERVQPAPANIATDALIGQWRFDGDLDDTSPRDDDSSALTGTAGYTTGVRGDAVALDGSGAGVNLPSITTDPLIDSAAGSIALWFRAEQTNNAQMLVYGTEGGGDGFGGQNELHLHINSDGSLGAFIEGGGSDLSLKSGTQRVDDGEWHHAVFTWDINGQATLYLNGTVVDGAAHNARSFVATDVKVGRTAFSNGTNRYLDGAVDDLSIFDRALTAFEASSLVV